MGVFFPKIFFLTWTIFKIFIEFITILLLFYVLVFSAMRHVGFLLPDKGSNPHVLHWKAKSYPLNHQGSPLKWVYFIICKLYLQKWNFEK